MHKRDVVAVCLDSALYVPTTQLAAADWTVSFAYNVAEAKAIVPKGNFRTGLVIFTESDEKTLESVEEIVCLNNGVEWLAVTSPTCMQSPEVCRLIGRNFFDYHTIPVDPIRFLMALGHADGKSALNRQPDDSCPDACEYQIIGSSPVMQQLFQDMRKIQGSDSPVLITGESGTGKELAAKEMHGHSPRRKMPFVAVNCGALPTQLIQSELFGHEKGAFTGALQRKIGRIEAASGGTVFLDEIGDIPLELQVNLLRFLQEKTIERVGSNHPVSVDVRVIAATNVELERAVKEGRFREDLYYRLNVLRLRMPPLRERGKDIEALARYFMDKFSQKEVREVKRLSKKAVQALNNHYWPGNVRELINRIKRSVVLSDSSLVMPSDLGLVKPETKKSLLSLAEIRERAELEAVRTSLQQNMNNVTEASRQLQVSRVTFYRLMNKFRMNV